jgi:hypothetical protein
MLEARPPRARVFRYTLTLRAAMALILWALIGFGLPSRLEIARNHGYQVFWIIAGAATLLASPFLVMAIGDALWSARGRVVLGLEELKYRPAWGKPKVIPYESIESALTERVREGVRPGWLVLSLEGGEGVKIRTIGLGRWGLFLKVLRERAELGEAIHVRQDVGRKRDVPVTVYGTGTKAVARD